MSLEEWLVDRDVLDRDDALLRHKFDHPIDQKKRITVRQDGRDLLRVDRQVHGGGGGVHQWRSLINASICFSSAAIRRAIPSSWRMRAALRRHARFSSTGAPEEYTPGSRMEWVTSVLAVMVTPSATSRWPSTPAPPPIRQSRPMVALPATAAQPANALCAPMRTLCAIWIRLSSRTSSSSTVSSRAPRSIVVLAPISQSSPMRTPPS